MTNADRPAVGVAAIVIKDNRVLFGKRIKKHGAYTWHFPGGHLEYGESFADTAIRETKEETDVDIEYIKTLTVTNDFFEDNDKHYVTVFTLNRYKSGRPKTMEPEKAEGWDWYEWDKLPQPWFLPVKNFMKQGLNPLKDEIR